MAAAGQFVAIEHLLGKQKSLAGLMAWASFGVEL